MGQNLCGRHMWMVSWVASQMKHESSKFTDDFLLYAHLHVEAALEEEAHAAEALVLRGGAEGAADVLAPLLHVENGLMEVNNLRYFVWEAACSEVSTHNFLQTPCANIME